MTAPAVILSRPQLGENIGSAARAMKNFGLTDLRLIAPQCDWPNDRAMILASGAGDIIESARVFATAAEALADIRILFATTARGRDVLREILTPEAAARRLRVAASEEEADDLRMDALEGLAELGTQPALELLEKLAAGGAAELKELAQELLAEIAAAAAAAAQK